MIEGGKSLSRRFDVQMRPLLEAGERLFPAPTHLSSLSRCFPSDNFPSISFMKTLHALSLSLPLSLWEIK